MVFQNHPCLSQLLEHFRHFFFHRKLVIAAFDALNLGQVPRCSDPGHNIFTLGINQKLTVKRILACGWITRERNASRAIITHIAEHHRLHIHRSPPRGRDIIKPTIGDRTLVHPAVKHSPNRTPKLGIWILRKALTSLFTNNSVVILNQLFKIVTSQVNIIINAFGIFHIFQRVFEKTMVNTKNNITKHLDKAAIGIPCKAFVARLLSKPDDNLIVQAKVEHGVHHPRHGSARA